MIVARRLVLTVLLALVSFTSFAQESKVGQKGCVYDKDAMLALNETEFDQNPNGGWRILAQDEACLVAAADLIGDYRATNSVESPTLYWHEGQVRAMAGQSTEAITLFERSRVKEDSDIFGWNYYVAATIAFIQNDRVALMAARERLSRVEQPLNLEVVDRLITCFKKTYKEAYGSCSQ